MSDETTEAGVGERACLAGPACPRIQHADACRPACGFAPATPDAGDDCEDGVFGSQDIATALGGRGPGDASEGLIEVLEVNVTISALMAGAISGPQAVAAINGRATGIVAAREAAARADERERIAQAIAADRDLVALGAGERAAYDRAARIARSPR